MSYFFMHAAYVVPLFVGLWIGAMVTQERTAYRMTIASQVFSLLSSVLLCAIWLLEGKGRQSTPAFNFSFVEWQLGVDSYTLVFLVALGWIGTFSTIYSRRYLHREEGVTRFFALTNLFCGGMALVLLSGNMMTLTAGWEVIGTASFLLIAFYHRREAASRAAMTAFGIYRFCDVALLTAGALMGTHSGGQYAWLLPVLLVIGAMGKSGQFPFTYWVARAMEGPSSSSAFFYGAMSTHAGVYILIRLMPYWQHQPVAIAAVGLTGLVTALTSTWVMRTQPTIKGRVAYAGTTQTGLMLMELAAGMPRLAAIHFLGNALLRCYQLLASPAIAVSRMQHQRVRLPSGEAKQQAPSRFEVSSYVLALRECAMPDLFQRRPLLRISRLTLIALLTLSAAFIVDQFRSSHPGVWGEGARYLLAISAFFGLIAATKLQSPQKVWNACLLAGLAAAAGAAMSLEPHASWSPEMYWPASYALSVLIFWILASSVHRYLATRGYELEPGEYFGGASYHPMAARFGLLALLGLSGFPFFPLFFGEDWLMEHFVAHDPLCAAFFIVAFFGTGVGAAASYCRTFHGPSPQFVQSS